MKLRDLLGNLMDYIVYLNKNEIDNVEISGVSIDNRSLKKGEIFVAQKGFKFDGVAFVENAIGCGASAIVLQEGSEMAMSLEALKLAESKKIPVILVQNTAVALVEILAVVYPDIPSNICGITGTNGKTTIVEFTRQIWTQLGIPSASIGTIGLNCEVENPRISALKQFIEDIGLTTPDAVSMRYVLSELKACGIDHVAIETSSNGLEQRRCDVPYIAGGFSSFKTDHLDFHDGIESYFAAKKILFAELVKDGGFAVINMDMQDFSSVNVVDSLVACAKEKSLNLIRYGRKGEEIKIIFEEEKDGRIFAAIEFFGKEFDLVFPMANHYMFMSALNAAAFVNATVGKHHRDEIVYSIENLADVEGRWQKVGETLAGAEIYIDYAHNGEAIENILVEAKKLVGSNGSVISVIGGAGGKPKERVQELAEFSAKFSDISILTTDSPRNEKPAEIVAKMLEISPKSIGVVNRIDAVKKAVEFAKAGDIIVICGKGHEKTLTLNGRAYYISDKQIVNYVLGDDMDAVLLKEIADYNKNL